MPAKIHHNKEVINVFEKKKNTWDRRHVITSFQIINWEFHFCFREDTLPWWSGILKEHCKCQPLLIPVIFRSFRCPASTRAASTYRYVPRTNINRCSSPSKNNAIFHHRPHLPKRRVNCTARDNRGIPTSELKKNSSYSPKCVDPIVINIRYHFMIQSQLRNVLVW